MSPQWLNLANPLVWENALTESARDWIDQQKFKHCPTQELPCDMCSDISDLHMNELFKLEPVHSSEIQEFVRGRLLQISSDHFSCDLTWSEVWRHLAMAVVAVRRPRDFPEARTCCSAITVHGFNILQPCLSLGINKTSPPSSDKLASMSPADGQTSKFQAMSRSQGFQMLSVSDKSNVPSLWIQNSALSKVEALSQLADRGKSWSWD